MKILLFNQPFPMGEYHLKQAESNYLTGLGHEVYLLEQLNGRDYDDDYVMQIKELEPDVMYYGPLDHKTFEVVQQVDCKKILHMNSKGIFKNLYKDIIDTKDKLWTHLMSTSKSLCNEVLKVTNNVKHIEYCFVPFKESELVFKEIYAHDCVFLGQGHHRLTIPEFSRERDIYFMPHYNKEYEFNFKIYGSGWPTTDWYAGVLPAGDIGSLYSSVKCGISVIEADQHIFGMINNRYTEMGYCGCPIITFNYDDIDWFGGEKYLNFVSSITEFKDTVKKCMDRDDEIIKKVIGFKNFLRDKNKVYFEKMEDLIND
tara:strand:- start:2318 stop:3259 length:942 start_codon:yes stop_codon:yes gene_type:complete